MPTTPAASATSSARRHPGRQAHTCCIGNVIGSTTIPICKRASNNIVTLTPHVLHNPRLHPHYMHHHTKRRATRHATTSLPVHSHRTIADTRFSHRSPTRSCATHRTRRGSLDTDLRTPHVNVRRSAPTATSRSCSPRCRRNASRTRRPPPRAHTRKRDATARHTVHDSTRDHMTALTCTTSSPREGHASAHAASPSSPATSLGGVRKG